MINSFKISFIILLLFISTISISQNNINSTRPSVKNSWLLSAGFGCQMSGRKSEDFICSNITPLLNFTVGHQIVPLLAVQIGYKGLYFNYIGDNEKHHYYFFYTEAVLILNGLIKKEYNSARIWNLYLHAGPGYFYNYQYDRPNICANLGIQNNIYLSKQLQATFDISSIIGWDIYQGDEDILPSCVIGVSYSFK